MRGICGQNTSKDTREVEKSVVPYDAEGLWKGGLYYRKGEEAISDFEL